MQIGYLGPLEVRGAHGVLDVPGRRLRTLLGRLAVDVGRPVPHRSLIEALWPDEPPADPANALQSLVSRLRRTLGEPTLVEQLAGGYRLNVSPDDVDAVRFATLAAQGHAQLTRSPALAAETLTEALSLWRGEPLADDETLDADLVRTRLAELRLQALADRAEALLAGVLDPSDPTVATVVSELDQLVTEHPLREDLAALRMRALVAAGRPAEALAAYEATRAYLADTLGSDPSTALQDQHLAVLRLQDAPSSTARRTNLRAAVTSFVGRDDDARKVNKLLGGGRLVTIVGTGGAGKTRLASEVASSWVSRAPGGVWFVELAPVSDSDNVALAVLDALRSREMVVIDALDRAERPQREARDRVLQTLEDAEALIVVDNCEHVVDAVAGLVADVLGTCPGVRVIATSREPLGIDGETLYALTPLAVPDAGAPAVEVAGAASVRLLLDRAAAVGADLELDEATVADVVEVVRRLDGLPLAIELAAARLRVLSIAEVAGRLADRFRLLTGGRRTAMPRHRTLRAVVEWSWELLSAPERTVAEHFSVFGSGATADAILSVCPDVDGVDDVLHALVEKSLLVTNQDGTGTRFRMLETLREYGAERLAEQDQLEAARLAHALYFAALVREADQHLRSERQVVWLRRLDVERDNILTALAYLGEHDHPAESLDMAVAMAWGWMLRENGRDAGRWLQFALEVPGAQEQPLHIIAEALHLVTSIGAFSNPENGGEAKDRRAALILMCERLEPVEQQHHLVPLLRPLMLFFAEEREQAATLVDRTLEHADAWSRAAMRTMRVAFSENEGDIDAMREDVELSLAEWQQIGDHWGLAAALTSRGQLRTLDGDNEGAAADLEEALAHLRELGGSTADDLLVHMRLADLRAREGDFEGARRYAELVRGAEQAHGDWGQGLLGEVMLAGVTYEQGDVETFEASRARLQATLETLPGPSIFMAHATSVAHGFLTTFSANTGDLETARHHVVLGYAQGLTTADLPIVATVGIGVSAYALALGRPYEAAVILGASARLRGSDDRTNRAIVRLTASLQEALGDDLAAAFAEGRALDRDAALARLDPALLD